MKTKNLFILCLLIGSTIVNFSTDLHAATITVNSTSDSLDGSECTLRKAIINANNDAVTYAGCDAGSGTDEIIVPAGTYCLSIPNESNTPEYLSLKGSLDITQSLTISGADADTTIIAATCDGHSVGDRVFYLNSSITVTMTGVTITGGNTAVSGGGIFLKLNSHLRLSQVIVSGNSSGDYAGGIYVYSNSLTLQDSTVSGNTSRNDGGGIYFDGSILTIERSTVSDNISIGHSGGGIYFQDGSAKIANTTVSGNTANDGGGIYFYAGGSQIKIQNTTVSNNTSENSGGGIYSEASFQFINSIISGNHGPSTNGKELYCSMGVISYGNNFIGYEGYDSCTITVASGVDASTDILDQPPEALQINNLADNGGLTQTMSLTVGSAAINAGSCTDIDGNSITTDQRGMSRDSQCDIGSFEYISTDDNDGDGYTGVTDCNDGDAAINPGATEVCGGMDDDCDGLIDESGENIYYADSDGDGYGSVSSSVSGCSIPSGYVTNSTDCDDSNLAINPTAAEVCGDGIDNDCNSSTTDGTASVYYQDLDGDGFGNVSVSTSSCGTPTGYVADATDCNDASDSISPTISEVCSDSIDNDCDGSVDEGCSSGIVIESGEDIDSDGDGVIDSADAFPNDASESVDTDSDGIGDNTDDDDDGDGILDVNENNSTQTTSSSGGCSLSLYTHSHSLDLFFILTWSPILFLMLARKYRR